MFSYRRFRKNGLLLAVLIWLVTGNLSAQSHTNNDLFVPLSPPRSLYTIDCEVRFESATAVVSGVEEITLTNNSSLPLDRLAFAWVKDNQHSIEVSVGGQPITVVSSGTDDDDPSPMIVSLPKSVASGQELRLSVRFEKTYDLGPEDTKHLYTSWFPRIDWGVRSHDDFEVKIEYPAEYTFASSARYDAVSDSWRAKGVRQFGIFLLKDAAVLEERTGDILVRVIHTPKGIDCARLIMETAVDAIEFYTERFGFYPSDHIDIIPGDEAPNGGYPPATSLVVIHGMERMSEREELHWRWITAHELGHQYWYEHVLSETRRQFGWLMIGLGIYVDREFMQSQDFAADKHVELMDRYTNGVRAGLDTRADVQDSYLETITFDFNNVVIHGKGYSIISALECLLGDRLFDRIHSRSLRKFAGRRMTTSDFQSVCEEESDQDLDWFFDQWVRSSPFLSFEISSKECAPSGDGYRTEIHVKNTGTLDMPVPVTAYFTDNTEQTVFTGRRQATSIVIFDSAAPLKDAVIDADNELAMVIPSPTQEELEMRRMVSGISNRADIDALPEMVKTMLTMDIKQTLFWGQFARKLYDWEFYEEALAVFKRRTELLEAMQSEWVMSAYGWQGLLLDLLDRREEAVAAYQKALETETDREFFYEGDPVTIQRVWLQERVETPFTRPGK